MLLGDTATPVGGPTLRLPYRDRLRPLGAVEYAEFRDDIVRHGVRVPLVVNRDGALIDGHNRLMAILELGIHWDNVPRIEMDLASEEEVEAYICSANNHRRHLSREEVEEGRRQRDERIRRRVHGDGASTREVAKELGVSVATVHGAAQDVQHRTCGAATPSRKRKTNAERGEEVRQKVAALQTEGKSVKEISEAAGVAPRTVQHHMKVLKRPKTGDISPAKRAMLKHREEMRRQAEEFRRACKEQAGKGAPQPATPAGGPGALDAIRGEVASALLTVDGLIASATADAQAALAPLAKAAAAIRRRLWPKTPDGRCET